MDAALRERSIGRIGLFLVAGLSSGDGARITYSYAARDLRTGGHVTVASADVDLESGAVIARLAQDD